MSKVGKRKGGIRPLVDLLKLDIADTTVSRYFLG